MCIDPWKINLDKLPKTVMFSFKCYADRSLTLCIMKELVLHFELKKPNMPGS